MYTIFERTILFDHQQDSGLFLLTFNTKEEKKPSRKLLSNLITAGKGTYAMISFPAVIRPVTSIMHYFIRNHSDNENLIK